MAVATRDIFLPADDPKAAVRELGRVISDLSMRLIYLETRLQVNHAPPDKLKEGDLRYADGTAWNPGAGAGYYEYRGAAWHKL